MHSILWVGGENGLEAGLLARADIPFATIPAAGIHGVGIWFLFQNLWRIARGVLSSRRILQEFQPDVLFFTGGYLAVPMALAGRHIPTLLYVPDIEPGLALKFIARFADRIAVTVEESRAFFPRRTDVVVTGYPTRPDLKNWHRDQARVHFNLDPKLQTLLVFGGSLGARSINRALLGSLPQFLPICQVIHISGDLSWSEVETARNQLPSNLVSRYHPYPYLHDEMGAALASADLVISRAGASSLGELPLFGLPAILVPYPHAWRYQRLNAEYLTQRGGAIILDDNLLTDRLFSLTRELLTDNNRLGAMRQAMHTLARPLASEELADQLRSLASAHLKNTGGMA